MCSNFRNHQFVPSCFAFSFSAFSFSSSPKVSSISFAKAASSSIFSFESRSSTYVAWLHASMNDDSVSVSNSLFFCPPSLQTRLLLFRGTFTFGHVRGVHGRSVSTNATITITVNVVVVSSSISHKVSVSLSTHCYCKYRFSLSHFIFC